MGFESTPLTRRRFVAFATFALAGVFTGRGFAAGRRVAGATQSGAATASGRYVTQPGWNPPAVSVTRPVAAPTSPGSVFVSPFTLESFASGPGADAGTQGPMILDDNGEPVWFLPVPTVNVMNFRAQRYRGRNVLTWYEGDPGKTYGGSCVIYGDDYRLVKRVRARNGYSCDLHEFLITSRNTALLAIYDELRADLTSVGLSSNERVVEGIVQEVDIETGKVLFEWHSLDHVPVTESFLPQVTAAGNVDYFHLNSIAVDTDGHLLISARHTSTVYKLDRKTGAVKWRLGGKRNDFTIGEGAAFNFQHDVRRHADGTLTLFDNGAAGPGAQDVEPSSRVLRLTLDTGAMTADLVSAYVPGGPRLAIAMGDVQQLPDGNLFVGWGTAGSYSEFGSGGDLRMDAKFSGGNMTYRAFRFPWAGRPVTKPAIAAVLNGDGTTSVSVSWNGATEVANWRFLAGPKAAQFRTAAIVPRAGFETTATLQTASGAVAAVALDAHGKALGRTGIVRLTPSAS